MTRRLSGLPGVRLPVVPPDRTHVFYQYCAYLPDRDGTVLRCLKRGVDLETLHVDVCTRVPMFKPFASAAPGADATAHAVQIPVYESLTPEEVERVGSIVRDAAAPPAIGSTARARSPEPRQG
jgi:dTDP-4-amino-4,6-dideoxygalactose transaminase